MKNLWLHGMYWTVIGVLGFQLWAKTTSYEISLAQIETALKENNSVIKMFSGINLLEISMQLSTVNPIKYAHLATKAQNVNEFSTSMTNVLAKNLFTLENSKKVNLKEIRDSLDIYSGKFVSIIKEEDSILIKNIFIKKIIEDDTFWTNFKSNAKVYLALLKNFIRLDELMLQNYILNSIGCIKMEIKDTDLSLMIAPKNAYVLEGEVFEADVFLVDRQIPARDDINFFSGTQQLIINDGVAHIKEITNEKGLKTLKVRATIPDPETKELRVLQSEFQYHVLPKCRQNCE